MKRLILSLTTILMISGLFAQSILLTDKSGNSVGNNAIITIMEEPGGTDIFSYLDVSNIATDSLSILCKKTEISLISGSSNTFCWTQCYPPFTYVSPTPIKLASGETDSISFLGEYYPSGNSGTSIIAYTFFSQTNNDDSIRVEIHYAFNTVGIADLFNKGNFEFADAYPNPASTQATFEFHLPEFNDGYVTIMNLLGSEVKRMQLYSSQGKRVVSVNDLHEGVYFYSLVLDNEVISTHKLIIKR